MPEPQRCIDCTAAFSGPDPRCTECRLKQETRELRREAFESFYAERGVACTLCHLPETLLRPEGTLAVYAICETCDRADRRSDALTVPEEWPAFAGTPAEPPAPAAKCQHDFGPLISPTSFGGLKCRTCRACGWEQWQ